MTLKIDGTLLLAGAGNMGVAMLAGWLEGGLDPRRRSSCRTRRRRRAAKELLDKHGIKAQATSPRCPRRRR